MISYRSLLLSTIVLNDICVCVCVRVRVRVRVRVHVRVRVCVCDQICKNRSKSHRNSREGYFNKLQIMIDSYKFLFYPSVIRLWNSLPLCN